MDFHKGNSSCSYQISKKDRGALISNIVTIPNSELLLEKDGMNDQCNLKNIKCFNIIISVIFSAQHCSMYDIRETSIQGECS